MSATIHERIADLVEIYGGGKNTVFANLIGVSEGNIRGYIKGVMPKQDILESIVRNCDGISATWLLTGKGSMREQPNLTTAPVGEGIPLIPIDAMAGYFAGELTVELSECERYVVPSFRSADFLITVKGDSMVPRYFSGDLVACKRLSLNDIFFQWGKVYILDTDQGALIKKVEQGDTPETITCVSVNTDYKPFQLRRESIYNIAIVQGIIRAE